GAHVARGPAGLDRVVRRDREVLRADPRPGRVPARLPLLGRGAAPGRHPHPLLDPRHLGPGVHHRPAVRDRGGVLHALGRRAGLRRRLLGLVRPARARPLRVRLHDGREGRDRHRRGARLHADLGRDRRPRGHGHRLGAVPLRHPAARGVARPALHVHGGRRGGLLRELPGRGGADRRGLLGRVLPDLLALPEPAGLPLLPDQGDGHGHGHRARRLLLRLQRPRRAGGGRDRHREVHGPEHRVRAPHRDARHPDLLGREPARPHRRL
ncbi:MAG: hypothetical protein AVDCRST_MAG13-2070, partial [uncultured Solirubrobacteraceae bacterium]